jgi:hypothetical protein
MVLTEEASIGKTNGPSPSSGNGKLQCVGQGSRHRDSRLNNTYSCPIDGLPSVQ